jgi:hypothetical protein
MSTLPDDERCNRSQLLSEAYIPYLRERHPMGSVVAINLLTAEYVVGEHAPDAMKQYSEKWGDDANMYIEPIHSPDTRPLEEQIASAHAWLKRRNRKDEP